MFFLGSMAKGYNALIQVILMLTTPAHTSTVWHLDFHVFWSDALLLIMSSILKKSHYLLFMMKMVVSGKQPDYITVLKRNLPS